MKGSKYKMTRTFKQTNIPDFQLCPSAGGFIHAQIRGSFNSIFDNYLKPLMNSSKMRGGHPTLSVRLGKGSG